MKKRVRDVAYGSYMWVGVAILILCMARLVSNPPDTIPLNGLLLAFIALPMFVIAAAIGVAASIMAFRDLWLVLLAVLTMSIALVLFNRNDATIATTEFLMYIFSVSVVIFLLGTRWFAVARKRAEKEPS